MKLVKFYDKGEIERNRSGEIWINPNYITSIQVSKYDPTETKIEFIGNAGYHTKAIYVDLRIETVKNKLTEKGT